MGSQALPLGPPWGPLGTKGFLFPKGAGPNGNAHRFQWHPPWARLGCPWGPRGFQPPLSLYKLSLKIRAHNSGPTFTQNRRGHSTPPGRGRQFKPLTATGGLGSPSGRESNFGEELLETVTYILPQKL